MKKYLINIFLIIVWMFTIFHLSNQTGVTSKNTSNSFIVKIVTIVSNKELSPEEQTKLTKNYSKIVRKTAHFTAYFILAFLVYRLYYKMYGISSKAFLYTLILCFIYACSDELHQSFISGRSCELLDVFIDTCGSLLSTTIFTYLYHKIKKAH